MRVLGQAKIRRAQALVTAPPPARFTVTLCGGVGVGCVRRGWACVLATRRDGQWILKEGDSRSLTQIGGRCFSNHNTTTLWLSFACRLQQGEARSKTAQRFIPIPKALPQPQHRSLASQSS